ncbi:EmrB/QacA subfamily drug resistance transporter [Ilumatobacter fluminis]|uniref:EmrB/QacA subfamily drug resistance transporter n=1 Tax=Ilumatobacter fluminis TaxID=467091 RepID=A0A4R7HX55_9ACTN|nr:DHA2 family efflux MFS transporter permease subunit [Ilumatobacter fluminis]TDT15742.1 EmrB/QacA subfamily drug resistance transporter [Ilumatobacter fluminis]
MAEVVDEARRRRTLTIASLATLATFLDTTILFVAFPEIGATFSDTSPATLSWVLNAYTIVFAAFLIPAGKIADRVGHRRSFLAGSALFTVASMVCGLAPTAELLIAGRIVQAVGGAILIPASLALVMRAYPRHELPRAVAIWGAAGAVAGALGPTLGAAVVEGLGWRWAFFINLPVGAYTIIAGRRTLQESSDPDTAIPNTVGVVLVAAAAGAISYAVVETETNGWWSSATIGWFVLGAVLVAVFVAHQRRTAAPVLDLDLFRIRNVAWSDLAGLVFGVAFSAMFLASILFLTSVWGWTVLEAGFGVAPGPALVAILAPRLGSLAGRIGQRPILVAGALAYAAGGLWRVVALGPDVDYLVDYFPSMLLTGFGVACIWPQLSSAVAQALPPNRAGIGGASLQAARQFGGTFGVAIAVALVAGADSLEASLDAFEQVWWVIVIGGVGTALLVLPMRTAASAPVAPVSAAAEA